MLSTVKDNEVDSLWLFFYPILNFEDSGFRRVKNTVIPVKLLY